MSTTDDARAEARKRYLGERDSDQFIEGAEWQASRKVEAPADEREALQEELEKLLYPWLELDARANAADAILAAGYRKVEITDEMVERGCAVLCSRLGDGPWEDILDTLQDPYRDDMRAALIAALGGGE